MPVEEEHMSDPTSATTRRGNDATETTSPDEDRHDVFISYSRSDRERVRDLSAALETNGKRCWVDLEDIPPSAEWMSEIRSAIDAVDVYLVAISPDLASSKIC